VDLPTRTGDVSVHLSCTLQTSQPPVTRTRKVLYPGFAQRPLDEAAAEAGRGKLDLLRSRTHTTVSQEPGYLGDSPAARAPIARALHAHRMRSERARVTTARAKLHASCRSSGPWAADQAAHRDVR